jgi:hypothetical protein
MNYNAVLELIGWYFIWYLFCGIFNYILIPRKISFRTNKKFTIIYSLFFVLLAILLFDKVNLNIGSPKLAHLLPLIALVVVLLADCTFLAVQKKIFSHFGKNHRKTSPLLGRAFELIF